MGYPGMTAAEIDQLAGGDLIYTWWDSGAMGMEPVVFAVVRVNTKTVTADKLDWHGQPTGDRGRIRRQDIVGRWTDGFD